MLFAGARLYTARVGCDVPVAVLLQHARVCVESDCFLSLIEYCGIRYVRSTPRTPYV